MIFVFFFFASPKKETKNASLMIFFCKIIQFFCQHHPDRLFPASPAARLFGLLRQPTLKILPPRQLALSLKMFTEHFLNALSLRKKSYDGSFLIWVTGWLYIDIWFLIYECWPFNLFNMKNFGLLVCIRNYFLPRPKGWNSFFHYFNKVAITLFFYLRLFLKTEG